MADLRSKINLEPSENWDDDFEFQQSAGNSPSRNSTAHHPSHSARPSASIADYAHPLASHSTRMSTTSSFYTEDWDLESNADVSSRNLRTLHKDEEGDIDDDSINQAFDFQPDSVLSTSPVTPVSLSAWAEPESNPTPSTPSKRHFAISNSKPTPKPMMTENWDDDFAEDSPLRPTQPDPLKGADGLMDTPTKNGLPTSLAHSHSRFRGLNGHHRPRNNSQSRPRPDSWDEELDLAITSTPSSSRTTGSASVSSSPLSSKRRRSNLYQPTTFYDSSDSDEDPQQHQPLKSSPRAANRAANRGGNRAGGTLTLKRHNLPVSLREQAPIFDQDGGGGDDIDMDFEFGMGHSNREEDKTVTARSGRPALARLLSPSGPTYPSSQQQLPRPTRQTSSSSAPSSSGYSAGTSYTRSPTSSVFSNPPPAHPSHPSNSNPGPSSSRSASTSTTNSVSGSFPASPQPPTTHIQPPVQVTNTTSTSTSTSTTSGLGFKQTLSRASNSTVSFFSAAVSSPASPPLTTKERERRRLRKKSRPSVPNSPYGIEREPQGEESERGTRDNLLSVSRPMSPSAHGLSPVMPSPITPNTPHKPPSSYVPETPSERGKSMLSRIGSVSKKWAARRKSKGKREDDDAEHDSASRPQSSMSQLSSNQYSHSRPSTSMSMNRQSSPPPSSSSGWFFRNASGNASVSDISPRGPPEEPQTPAKLSKRKSLTFAQLRRDIMGGTGASSKESGSEDGAPQPRYPSSMAPRPRSMHLNSHPRAIIVGGSRHASYGSTGPQRSAREESWDDNGEWAPGVGSGTASGVDADVENDNGGCVVEGEKKKEGITKRIRRSLSRGRELEEKAKELKEKEKGGEKDSGKGFMGGVRKLSFVSSSVLNSADEELAKHKRTKSSASLAGLSETVLASILHNSPPSNSSNSSPAGRPRASISEPSSPLAIPVPAPPRPHLALSTSAAPPQLPPQTILTPISYGIPHLHRPSPLSVNPSIARSQSGSSTGSFYTSQTHPPTAFPSVENLGLHPRDISTTSTDSAATITTATILSTTSKAQALVAAFSPPTTSPPSSSTPPLSSSGNLPSTPITIHRPRPIAAVYAAIAPSTSNTASASGSTASLSTPPPPSSFRLGRLQQRHGHSRTRSGSGSRSRPGSPRPSAAGSRPASPFQRDTDFAPTDDEIDDNLDEGNNNYLSEVQKTPSAKATSAMVIVNTSSAPSGILLPPIELQPPSPPRIDQSQMPSQHNNNDPFIHSPTLSQNHSPSMRIGRSRTKESSMSQETITGLLAAAGMANTENPSSPMQVDNDAAGKKVSVTTPALTLGPTTHILPKGVRTPRVLRVRTTGNVSPSAGLATVSLGRSTGGPTALMVVSNSSRGSKGDTAGSATKAEKRGEASSNVTANETSATSATTRGGAGDGSGAEGVVPPVRRNSLGDLKIPARISQAQVGLRRDLGMVREFAANIEQLRELRTTYYGLMHQIQSILDQQVHLYAQQQREQQKQAAARAQTAATVASSSALAAAIASANSASTNQVATSQSSASSFFGGLSMPKSRSRANTTTEGNAPGKEKEKEKEKALPPSADASITFARQPPNSAAAAEAQWAYKRFAASYYTINSRYRIAWECAELLIELGGGASDEKGSGRGHSRGASRSGGGNKDGSKKGGTQVPSSSASAPQHLSASGNDSTGGSDRGSIGKKGRERAVTLTGDESRPSTPLTLTVGLPSATASTNAGAKDQGHPPPGMNPQQAQAWRASTGRHDLSSRQLLLLKEMLSNPDSMIFDEYDTTMPPPPTGTHLPILEESATSFAAMQSSASLLHINVNREWRWGDAMNSTITLPSEESSLNGDRAGPSRPLSPNTLQIMKKKKRRTSRLGMLGLRDMLRLLKKTHAPPSNHRLDNAFSMPTTMAHPTPQTAASALPQDTRANEATSYTGTEDLGGHRYHHVHLPLPSPPMPVGPVPPSLNSSNIPPPNGDTLTQPVTARRRAKIVPEAMSVRTLSGNRSSTTGDVPPYTGHLLSSSPKPVSTPPQASVPLLPLPKPSPRRPSLASIFRIGKTKQGRIREKRPSLPLLKDAGGLGGTVVGPGSAMSSGPPSADMSLENLIEGLRGSPRGYFARARKRLSMGHVESGGAGEVEEIEGFSDGGEEDWDRLDSASDLGVMGIDPAGPNNTMSMPSLALPEDKPIAFSKSRPDDRGRLPYLQPDPSSSKSNYFPYQMPSSISRSGPTSPGFNVLAGWRSASASQVSLSSGAGSNGVHNQPSNSNLSSVASGSAGSSASSGNAGTSAASAGGHEKRNHEKGDGQGTLRSTRLSNVEELLDDDDLDAEGRRVLMAAATSSMSKGSSTTMAKRPPLSMHLIQNAHNTGSTRSARQPAVTTHHAPPTRTHTKSSSNATNLGMLPDPKLAMTPENIKPLLENAKEVHARLNDCVGELRRLLEVRPDNEGGYGGSGEG